MGKKVQTDRLLRDYGDAIAKMEHEIKNGATVIKKLPDDMTENSCPETAFRLAMSKVGETDEAHIRARRIRNDILNSGKRSFKLSAGDHFSTIAIVYYMEKFRECFVAVERGDANENDVVGAIEAAFAIGTLAPPNRGLEERLKKGVNKAQTSHARETKNRKLEAERKQIADAFRAVSNRDSDQLKVRRRRTQEGGSLVN
jgi:hypothetical protein